jgi:Ala-tRNA(Pro) deacylase
MRTLNRLLSFLDENGIRYAHSIHTRSQRAPAHSLAQTIVYWGDNGFGVLVLQADGTADLDEVRRLMGLTEIRLASEFELEVLFPDCEVGAMPPFGNLFDLPVLMDESIAVAPFMSFKGGTHRDVIHLSVGDYHQLANPLVAAFAVRKPAPALAPVWGFDPVARQSESVVR